MEKLSIERSIWIAAPRERVWHAITDPDQVEKWFSPGTSWRSDGMFVGARLYVHNPETNTDMYVQRIELVDPPHKLVTRSVPEPPETSYVSSWTLTEENGGTRLNFSYTGFELAPADNREQIMEQHGMGFAMMLENIKAHLEGKELPVPGGF